MDDRAGLIAGLAALALASYLCGCAFPRRPLQSVQILAAVAQGQAANTGAERVLVSYKRQTRSYRADLYLPSRARGGVLLIPGATREGKDDPRVVTFAGALARAHFAVLVPDLEDVRQIKMGTRDIREIADSFAYLVSRSDVVLQGHTGMIAPSYALGPTLLAALEPDLRNNVHFILGIGGYYDLKEVIVFLTTGYFRDETGQWRHRRPNEYGKWVFALNNVDRLSDRSDQMIMRTIAQRRMARSDAPVELLARQLHDKGRRLFELLTNKDPQRVPELIARLPGAVKKDITALDLSQHDLSPLHAHLILVHGLDDSMIPYTQSVALAHALPRGQAHVYLVHGLAHVDLRGPALHRRLETHPRHGRVARRASMVRARHPERSRGISWRKLKGNLTGSFDFAALRSG